MKKLLILTLLIGSMLTGCSSSNESKNAKMPDSSKQVESSATPKEQEPSKSKKSSEKANSKTQAPATTHTGVQYMKKLIALDKEVAKLQEDKVTTYEMKEAASEAYQKWDKALNEIYGELKKQLSPKDMEALRNKQRKWITYRDAKAKKESEGEKGGTLEGLVYVMTLGEVTRDRCYELVEKYMD